MNTMNAIRVLAGEPPKLVLTELPVPQPGAGQVLIKVAAAGLNRADLLQAEGRYPPPKGAPDTLGMEVSGAIVALGNGVKAWREGDAVCALLPGGGYAEYALASALCLLARAQRRRLVRSRGAARSLFHRVDQYVGYGPAEAGRNISRPWRHQRHRRGGHPADGGARPSRVHDRGQCPRNAPYAKSSAPRAPSITARKISSPW